jgi:hypothetical protein
MELCSKSLSEQQWTAALDALSKFLRAALPQSMLTAEYGFGCEIHADLTYIPMRVPVARLNEFLHESVEQRIFLPGRSDLHIHDQDRNFSITLCHEGDIHVSDNHTGLLQQFLSLPLFGSLEFAKR